jgi:hypothetical protein
LSEIVQLGGRIETGGMITLPNNTTTTFVGMDDVIKEWWNGLLRDLGVVADIGLGFVPVVETLYDIFQVVSGYSLAGKLSPEEKLIVVGAALTPLPGASGGVAKAVKEALEKGGRHSGLLKEYAKRSPKEIEKALRSYEKQVAIHKEKIANPAKFAKNWDGMTNTERAGLLTKWQKDLIRNQELADIMQYLLKIKGGQ